MCWGNSFYHFKQSDTIGPEPYVAGCRSKGKTQGVNLSLCEGCQCSEIMLKKNLVVHTYLSSCGCLENVPASHQMKCRGTAQIACEETGALFLLGLQSLSFSTFFSLSLWLSFHLIRIAEWTHCLFVLEDWPAKHICLEKRISNRVWCDCSACPERQACEESRARIKRRLWLSTHCRAVVKHWNVEPCTCNSETDFLSSPLETLMPFASN